MTAALVRGLDQNMVEVGDRGLAFLVATSFLAEFGGHHSDSDWRVR
jgi:hypothetical protein